MRNFVASFLVFSTGLIACGKVPAQNADTHEWGQSVRQGKSDADELRNMTDAQEYSEGKEIDAALKDPNMAAKVGMTIRIVNNSAVNNLVNRVGQTLAAASSRNNISYTFQVIDSNDVNAFATLGGFVYVNKGLLKAAQNEAQLAGVIAHEIGHIAGRHVVNAMARQAELNGWKKGVGGFGGTAVILFSQVAFGLPKSRTNEFEADEMGFLTVRKSGYVPDEMIRFYENVLLTMSKGGSTILSTHPATEQRIAGLQRLRESTDSQGMGANGQEYRAIVNSL